MTNQQYYSQPALDIQGVPEKMDFSDFFYPSNIYIYVDI